jgi:excisionase family DNA binding protein
MTGTDDAWPEVLTVDQAAAYLQVHRLTVYRYIRDGQLPAARLGKIYRLLRRDVDAFLDARRTDAPRRTGGARRTDGEPASRAAAGVAHGPRHRGLVGAGGEPQAGGARDQLRQAQGVPDLQGGGGLQAGRARDTERPRSTEQASRTERPRSTEQPSRTEQVRGSERASRTEQARGTGRPGAGGEGA